MSSDEEKLCHLVEMNIIIEGTKHHYSHCGHCKCFPSACEVV